MWVRETRVCVFVVGDSWTAQKFDLVRSFVDTWLRLLRPRRPRPGRGTVSRALDRLKPRVIESPTYRMDTVADICRSQPSLTPLAMVISSSYAAVGINTCPCRWICAISRQYARSHTWAIDTETGRYLYRKMIINPHTSTGFYCCSTVNGVKKIRN